MEKKSNNWEKEVAETLSLLGASDSISPSPGFTSELMHRIAADREAPVRRLGLKWLAYAAAIALIAVNVTVMISVWRSGTASEMMASSSQNSTEYLLELPTINL